MENPSLDGNQPDAPVASLLWGETGLANGGDKYAQLGTVEAIEDYDSMLAMDGSSSKSDSLQAGRKFVEIKLADFSGGCRSSRCCVDELKIHSATI